MSLFYLNHRYSEDLDFFSETSFGDEIVNNLVDEISSKIGVSYRFTQIENTKMFQFVKEEKLTIKVDFAYFPYLRLRKEEVYQGVEIDSLLDIATNKLLTIVQRKNVKDFVDLFYLFDKFTIWDLLLAVEKKFGREIDLILLAANFLLIEDFDYLPKMILPLQLSILKQFFTRKAKEITERVIER